MPDGPTREQWVDGLQWELHGNDEFNPAISIVNPTHMCICDFYDEYGENDFLPTIVPHYDAVRHSRLAVMAPKLWLKLLRAAELLREVAGAHEDNEVLECFARECLMLLDEAVLKEDNIGNP